MYNGRFTPLHPAGSAPQSIGQLYGLWWKLAQVTPKSLLSLTITLLAISTLSAATSTLPARFTKPGKHQEADRITLKLTQLHIINLLRKLYVWIARLSGKLGRATIR